MPEKTKLWYLKSVNLLEGLSERELKALAGRTSMSKNDFMELLKKNPELNLRMIKLIGLKLRKVESKVEDLIFKNVRERIMTFLFRFAEAFGKIKERQISVPKFLSQDEIAHMTGASRQTVATILNELRKEGVIDFTTKSLTVLKPESFRIE